MNIIYSTLILLFVCFTLGCSQDTMYSAGQTYGVPQEMTQNTADGYIDKTTGSSSEPNPYNR